VGVRLVTFAVALAMLAGVQPASGATAAAGLEVVFLEAAHGDTVLYRGPCGEVGLIDATRGAVDEDLTHIDALRRTRRAR
jgi:hypothetical protein